VWVFWQGVNRVLHRVRLVVKASATANSHLGFTRRAQHSAPRDHHKMPRTQGPANVFPSDIVCDSLVQLFVSMIDESDMDERTRLAVVATALRRLEGTSNALRLRIRSDARVQYYRFFFYTSVDSVVPRRFLDGTFDVAIFTGKYGDGPSNQARFDVLQPKDVLKDRINTAKRLSELSIDQVLLRSTHYLAEDLPSGVGPRVSAFVGRARFLTQHRANAAPNWRRTCQFANCCREMLCADGTTPSVQANPLLADIFGDPIVSGDDDEDDDEDNDDQDDNVHHSGYWPSISPRPLTMLPKCMFCSLTCSLAYEHELASSLPVRVCDAEIHETFSSASGKVGLSRTLASTRAAFKRNDAAARALREAMRSIRKRKTSTICTELFAKMHQNIMDVLNVDLGLMYAAASLADSPGASCGRLLPATSAGWRDTPKFSRAIERVKSIYLQYHRKKDGLARDERFPPIWLRKCRDQALVMFPPQLER